MEAIPGHSTGTYPTVRKRTDAGRAEHTTVDSVAREDPDLAVLDKVFQKMRPKEKQRFLKDMERQTPDLKKRWDAYQAARQQAFAQANPPVPPLDPATERGIRQSLRDRYGNLQEMLNLPALVDADGCGPAYGDVLTDFETSVTFQGAPLNADHALYHVNRMDRPDLNDALAISFYKGRMVPSIFGDEGPGFGEASHLTIQLLGMYSSPIDGGDSSGHDMYFIPGLGAEFMKTGQAPTPENLTAFCCEQGVPGFTA